MNLSYFKFLFINLLRKKSIWITFSLFLFTISAFLLIVPAVGNISPLQLWAQPTMVVCQTFVGIIISIYCAILAINVFKDPIEDGSDLIIISKPVKKISIIFSKILIFGIYCLLANLSSILLTFFTIFLPKTEIEFYWKLIFSLFIGNIVSFAVFGSIAGLLSVKTSKLGVIVINVIISIFLLIYQIISLFVVPTPTKTMLENGVSVTSYILSDRNITTGEYTEDNVANFYLSSDTIKTNIEKDFSNWKGVEKFWKDVYNTTPTKLLNFTDIASQISYSYLSGGLQDYSDRQAKRFFASSTRAYNYNLTSPASPEIIENIDNKKSLSVIYDGNQTLWIAPNISISLPDQYLISGIKSNSELGLKGFSNKIPVGTIKSKGQYSKEIYLEPKLWVKYSKPFDIMFDHCFKYNLGIDDRDNYYTLSNDQINNPEQLYSSFYNTNENLSKMFAIIWSCFTGHSSEEQYFGKNIMQSSDQKIQYDKDYFDIKTIDDLNERFIQFKYYCFEKIKNLQAKLIDSGYVWIDDNSFELEAKKQAIDEFNSVFPIYFNIAPAEINNWYIKHKDYGTIDIIEPNTQTVSYQLLKTSWNCQKKILENNSIKPTDKIYINNAINSALYKVNFLSKIAIKFVNVNEKYLYTNFDTPERTSDSKSQTYTANFSWITYPESLIHSGGINSQWFFYTNTRKYNYWWFALFWLSVSLLLTAGTIIVYKKYDIK